MEGSPFAIAVLDKELRYLLVSERWLSDFYLGDQDLVGRLHYDVIPEVPQRLKDVHTRCLAGATEGGRSDILVRKDGRRERVNWDSRPWTTPSGEIGGIIIMIEFVTAWKEAEEELRRVNAQLAEAQRLARLGYWEWNLETNAATWSPEVYRIFGRDSSNESLSFDDYFATIPAAEQEAVSEWLAAAIKRGEPFNFEHSLIHPDGTRHVAIDGRVLHNDAGEPIKLLGVAQDVTERHQLEEQLHESQKMEATGRLAGGIAHDFNNILTAIFSFSEFAVSSLSEDHPARDDMHEVIRAADQAKTLTQQLLAFSRRQTVVPRVLRINDRVQSVESMMRRILGEDIAYSTHLEAELWNTRVDPNALEQVIINLAINARDAMPGGGRLTIETANVTLGEGKVGAKEQVIPQGDYVAFIISDDGEGMSEKVRQQIFEPFYTTKSSGNGTGLGLSTCYGIIRQANGFLWVYSELGQGTTFKVYLPRVHDPVDPVATVAEPAAGGGDETVLVAEDNPQVRQLTVRTLEELGYQVLVGDSAEQALETIANIDFDIDLLITDVIMPGMNGKQLSDRVVARHPRARVLYMSGYSENTIVHHGVLEDGIELLQKPFSPSDLAKRIRQLLEA